MPISARALSQTLADTVIVYDANLDDPLGSTCVWHTAPSSLVASLSRSTAVGMTAREIIAENPSRSAPHYDRWVEGLLRGALMKNEPVGDAYPLTDAASIAVVAVPFQTHDGRTQLMVALNMALAGADVLAPAGQREGLIVIEGETVLSATTTAVEVLGLERRLLRRLSDLEPMMLSSAGVAFADEHHPLRRLVREGQIGETRVAFVPPAVEGAEPELRWIWLASQRMGSRVLLSVIDTTTSVEHEHQLARSEARWRGLANEAPIGILQLDNRGSVVYANRNVEAALGVCSGDALGVRWLELVHPADLSGLNVAWGEAAATQESLEFTVRILVAANQWRRVKLRLAPFSDDGELLGYVGSMEDISRVVDMRAKLNQATLLQELSAECTNQMFMRIDVASGHMLDTSGAVGQMVGRLPEQMLNRPIGELLHPDDVPAFEAMVQTSRRDATSSAHDLRLCHSSGQFHHMRVVGRWQMDVETGREELWCVVTDVSAEKLEHAAIDDARDTDPLSGMLSASAFERAVTEQISAGAAGGMVLGDLDGFGRLNDQFGVAVGNSVISQLADRIRPLIPVGGVAARLADAYVVYVPDAEEADLRRLGSAMQASVDASFGEPGSPVYLSITVGIARWRAGKSASQMLRAAELAIIAGREETGPGALRVHDAALRARRDRQDSIRQALQEAIATGRGFELRFEPQIEVATGQVRRVEALLTFDHIIEGRISPEHFLPIAETSGLIRRVDAWLLEEAIGQCTTWASDLRVAVNFSRHALLQRGLIETLVETVQRHGLAPARLVIELPGDLPLSAMPAQRALATLSEHGFPVVYQDLSACLQSVTSGAMLGVNQLKLPAALVSGYGTDGTATAILDGVMRAAESMQIPVCALGVDNRETFHTMVGLGCRYVQGKLFSSQPMTAAGVLQRVRERGLWDLDITTL